MPRVGIVATLTTLLLISMTTRVLASDSGAQAAPRGTPGGLAASPARIEAGVPHGTGEVALEVSVTNRGAEPSHVHATLADLVVTQAGAYETAPAGQTPYSISRVAHLDHDELDLDVSGSAAASGVVHISGSVSELDRPLYGGLTLELEDQHPALVDLNGLRVAPQVRPSILIPVLLVPLGESSPDASAGSMLGESIELDLRGVSVMLAQRDEGGLLDRLIPLSLPGIADHGPLAASARVQNVGNAFGRAFTTYSFAAVNPFGWLPEAWRARFGLDERSFLEAEAAPAALMPDMTGETRALSTYAAGPGAEHDASPWFGLVRVRAASTLVLADFVTAPVVQEGYVLVVPWKELLVLVLAWRLWCFWRARQRRAAVKRVELPLAEDVARTA